MEKENPSLGRISEINTYLLIYALYANDYCVKLPQNIIVNIRLFAKQNHIFLTEIDNQVRNTRSATYTYPSVLENYFYNSKLIEADKLAALPNKTNVNNINNLLMMTTSLFFCLRTIPVIYQVGKNIHKDLIKGSHLIGNFLFKKNIKSILASNFDDTQQQCRLM